jgi:tetratricopeptide (TPR) repeat protein
MNIKEKRRFRRYIKNTHFDLKCGSKQLKAKMLDYSLSGVRALVEDSTELKEGDIVDLIIREPEIKTAGGIVWSIKDSSGLQIGIEHIGQMKGLLKNFRLADTLIGLQRSQKTGILTVESGDIVKKIYIKNGDMIFSASNQKEDRLGDLLLKEGRITIEQYDHSVDEMKKTKQRQGAVLVRLGYFQPQELVTLVRHQVEEIILSLFSIEEGRFAFEEMPLPTEEVITLKLSAANLIYYGIKRINNFRRIITELPSLDNVLCFSLEPLDLFQDIRLDESGKQILSFADGKNSIQEVVAMSQMNNFEALKTIYALLNARMVDITAGSKPYCNIPKQVVEEIFKEKEERIITVPLKDEIEEMHKKYQGLGYYGVLGVKNLAAINEIKSAYYKAAKKYHPDMHFHLEDDVLKDKLNDIFTYVYEAFATLSNPQRRKEYDKSTTLKPAKLISNSDKARELFEEGKIQLRKNNYPEAELLFGQAAYFDGTIPEYHYYYGLILMRLNKFKHAEKAINRALKLDPKNAGYLAKLGFVYLELNLPKRAEAFFRQALEISPDHASASEGMRKVT